MIFLVNLPPFQPMNDSVWQQRFIPGRACSTKARTQLRIYCIPPTAGPGPGGDASGCSGMRRSVSSCRSVIRTSRAFISAHRPRRNRRSSSPTWSNNLDAR